MQPRQASALAALLLAAASALAQSPAFTPSDEKPEDYPPGAGRDDTFYACTPCHGFRSSRSKASRAGSGTIRSTG